MRAQRYHQHREAGDAGSRHIMRLFVAVILSSDNQRRLRAPIDQLVQAHTDVLRATPDGMLHLTLAFMGRVGAQDVAAVDEAIHQAAQQHSPFSIVLAAPRILRARQDPRLVLLPVVDGAGPWEALARDLHRAIAARLPSLDLSPARSAHVTLARFRKHARAPDARAVEQSLTQAGVASLELHDEVRDLRLFESLLTAAGPHYEERLTAPLKVSGS